MRSYFETLLVAVGRAPNVNNIGLEEAGVAFDLRKGVQVTDHYKLQIHASLRQGMFALVINLPIQPIFLLAW